jgi:hypothetical protein
MAEATGMAAGSKPPLKPRRRIAVSFAIGTGIVAVALAIFSLFAGHNSAAQGTGAAFIHRIDRLTALCGSVGGAPRCRR